MTRSVLMLTTAGKTFATANTVGSAAGSAWAEAVSRFAKLKTKAISAAQIVRGIPMSAEQLTKRVEHCQLGRLAATLHRRQVFIAALEIAATTLAGRF